MDQASLLTIARQRGADQQLPYAGAVTPIEAFQLLSVDASVKLIDVRTQAERDWVGKVAIAEDQHLAISWNLYPGGKANPDFAEQLKQQIPDPGTTIVFLCRSGVRSRHAAHAASALGYLNCFDILEGFEGDKDQAQHRKTLGGWCFHNLPWIGA